MCGYAGDYQVASDSVPDVPFADLLIILNDARKRAKPVTYDPDNDPANWPG
ncbi:MAG: hypothetical protein WC080_01610 [Patescibacteria group bacterium]|jgi:hypothetical protein